MIVTASNALVGDLPIISAARHEARKNFETNRVLAPNSPESIAAIAHAEEVARILRHNIVQGKQTGEQGDNYSEFWCPKTTIRCS